MLNLETEVPKYGLIRRSVRFASQESIAQIPHEIVMCRANEIEVRERIELPPRTRAEGKEESDGELHAARQDPDVCRRNSGIPIPYIGVVLEVRTTANGTRRKQHGSVRLRTRSILLPRSTKKTEAYNIFADDPYLR